MGIIALSGEHSLQSNTTEILRSLNNSLEVANCRRLLGVGGVEMSAAGSGHTRSLQLSEQNSGSFQRGTAFSPVTDPVVQLLERENLM